MTQQQRDRVMGRLRSGNADLLLATDVAARGLDIDTLTHVVNYDVPSSPESYVHRIGRVGRAGREGVAITLAQPREHRYLKTVEKITKQRITFEKIPTVADLRARRLDLTRAGLEESLLEDGDLDHFRVVVETLAENYDLMDVAAAAVKLAHEAGGVAAEEEEIPDAAPPPKDRPTRPAKPGKRPDANMTRIFVGAGRVAGIRPKDLVGAITNEAGLQGRDIGGIEIGDRFALVEVPSDAADHVISALRGTTIKGKKATIRRERFTQPRR
jgi:ATP-dependent RNA helicase DeaD